MNKVLVVAVHPDDETLGCGGTLLKHKASGDKIYWLIVSKTRVKEKQINDVAKMYKFDGVYKLKILDARVGELPLKVLVDKISAVFNKVKPTIVYLPFNYDVHTDHRIIFDAAFSCTKSFRHSFVKKVLMMEIISETEFTPGTSFTPNCFINITDFLEKKMEIMQAYKTEIGKHPFPRSLKNIKALAVFRGATAGCDYAEAMMILKEIN